MTLGMLAANRKKEVDIDFMMLIGLKCIQNSHYRSNFELFVVSLFHYVNYCESGYFDPCLYIICGQCGQWTWMGKILHYYLLSKLVHKCEGVKMLKKRSTLFMKDHSLITKVDFVNVNVNNVPNL